MIKVPRVKILKVYDTAAGAIKAHALDSERMFDCESSLLKSRYHHEDLEIVYSDKIIEYCSLAAFEYKVIGQEYTFIDLQCSYNDKIYSLKLSRERL